MSSLATWFIYMCSSILRIHCSTFSLDIAPERRVLLHTPSIKPIRQGLGQNYNNDKTTTKDNTKHMHSNKKEAKTPTFNSNTKQQSIQSEKSKHTNNT